MENIKKGKNFFKFFEILLKKKFTTCFEVFLHQEHTRCVITWKAEARVKENKTDSYKWDPIGKTNHTECISHSENDTTGQEKYRKTCSVQLHNFLSFFMIFFLIFLFAPPPPLFSHFTTFVSYSFCPVVSSSDWLLLPECLFLLAPTFPFLCHFF